MAELEYAFDNWKRNGEGWWPEPQDIRELCDAYRLSEAQNLLPIGCERCAWTGFYTVKWRSKIERVVAECPCRINPTLRTKDTRVLATEAEMEDMWRKLAAFGIDKPKDKPKQVSGIVPTTKELAEELAKRGK